MGLLKFGEQEKSIRGLVRIWELLALGGYRQRSLLVILKSGGTLVPGMLGLGWSKGLGQNFHS